MNEIENLVNNIINQIGADRGTVWVRTYSKNRFVLQPFYMSGIDQSMINADFLKLDLIENFGKGQQIIDTLELNYPLVLNSRTNEYVNKIEGRLQYIVDSSLTIPIKFCDTTIGVLQLLNSKNGQFSLEEMNSINLDDLSICVVKDCEFVDIVGDLDFMVTHFGTQTARKLRTIWNLLNMLKTLQNYDDSDKGRLLYKKDIFDIYNSYIVQHLEEIEKELHKLYKYSEDKSWSIAKYLNQTFGRIKDDSKTKLREDFADVEIYMDILSRDYDSLSVYLDDYNVEEFEKFSILKLIKRNHNVRDFYNQTRSSIHIISVANIDSMLAHSANTKSNISNKAIINILDEAINQLLKFQKNVNTISYFGESSEYRFLVRNLDYFRDFCEVVAEQRFKVFHYANQKFSIGVEVILENDCEFETDAPKLCRVIESLMSNAAEELCEKELYTNSFDKKITVTLTSNNSDILISVKDNGRGVSLDAKARMFEKYYSYGKRSGSGIGLAFAKDIVEKGLNGEIYLNADYNDGAEFIIKFIK